MTAAPRHPTPSLRRVFASQLRMVGLALRVPAVVAAALVVLMALFLAAGATDAQPIHFHPEHSTLGGLLGVLLPVWVWMGEDRFGAGTFWTLPVDRRRHVLLKVLAGWMWLLGAVSVLLIWLLALAFVSGGTVLGEETRRVLPTFSFAGGPFDPGAVQTVSWTSTPLLWLVPYTGASAMYLLASAVTLGLRHPLRWIAVVVLGGVFIAAFAEEANANRVAVAAHEVLEWFIRGPYGVDIVLTAGTESRQVAATFTNGETSVVWRALPDVGEWAVASALWLAAGAVALAAAASRHRERRPA